MNAGSETQYRPTAKHARTDSTTSAKVSFWRTPFLLDTNVIAELRKGARANSHVRSWFGALAPDAIVLSVLTIREIRRGIENVRRRDSAAARALERWMRRLVAEHQDRILPVQDSDHLVIDAINELSINKAPVPHEGFLDRQLAVVTHR